MIYVCIYAFDICIKCVYVSVCVCACVRACKGSQPCGTEGRKYVSGAEAKGAQQPYPAVGRLTGAGRVMDRVAIEFKQQ